MPHAEAYWYSLKDPKPARPLVGEHKTSILIIGGGMAGLSAAQAFLEAGKKVTLIEKDFCGAGATGKSSGFITPDSEIELGSLLANYGTKKARRIWDFVLSGVEQIRKNIETYGLNCDYQKQDSLFLANTKRGFKQVEREHQARQTLSYKSTLYQREELTQVLGIKRAHGAVRYSETFGIDAYLYCQGLKELLCKKGLQLYEQTTALEISENLVRTSKGAIQAEHILVCTDRFLPELGLLEKEIYHVQTFLAVTKPLSPKEIKTIFPKEPLMVWDTDLVYNYFRLTGDGRLLIGGGNLLLTYAHDLLQNTEKMEQRLSAQFHKKFPMLDLKISKVWPGMLGVSKDLLPILRKKGSVTCIGAATGLPWAAALGHYAAEQILKGRKDYNADFSSERAFKIGPRLQRMIGKPATFALSHGIAKYL